MWGFHDAGHFPLPKGVSSSLLVGGFTNPSEKYARQNMDHETPIFGVKPPKIFELPPPRFSLVCHGSFSHPSCQPHRRCPGTDQTTALVHPWPAQADPKSWALERVNPCKYRSCLDHVWYLYMLNFWGVLVFFSHFSRPFWQGNGRDICRSTRMKDTLR